MILKPNTGLVPGTILAPDGSALNRPAQILSADEARLVREYKKFLQKYGLSEATHCRMCWENADRDGMRVQVTDSRIIMVCRHRQIYFGPSD